MSIDLLAKQNHHPRDSRIIFHEEPHIYEIDGSSFQYCSVTTLNHSYFKSFDPNTTVDSILQNKKYNSDPSYKYYQLPRQTILDQWSQSGKLASELGTQLHLDIEKYYNKLPVSNSSFEFQLFKQFVNDFTHLQPFRTEWTIFHEEAKIAGSIDMVFFNTKTQQYEIYDWKRVKEISMNPFKHNDIGLIPPLFDIPNTNFWHYSLQLNIYQYILHHKYNLRISNRCLIVLHPDNIYKRYMRYELPDLQHIIHQLFSTRILMFEIKNNIPLSQEPLPEESLPE